jgi:hypothetical protein
MLNILDKMLGEEKKPDDPNVLPAKYIQVYKNPHKFLGLNKGASISEIRTAFRKFSIAFAKMFSGSTDTGIVYEQIVLAYHLTRGTISGTALEVR